MAVQTERRILLELGEKVRRAREAAGFTQEEAAHKAGLDYKRYQRIEQGSVNATMRTLLRIARGFRMDLWELLAG